MPIRTLRLTMKKGVAIIKECTELPLKENVLLHVNEYTFYSNPTTFDKLVRMEAQEDMEKANQDLQNFFLKKAKPVNLTQSCFNFDQAIDEMKTDLMLGKEETSEGVEYADHWEKETNQQVLNAFKQKYLARIDPKDMPRIYTAPNNNYKAMVDVQKETIEFIQFEETFSALKGKNVMAEHITLHKRPMYLIHKLLALVQVVRDQTGNVKWGA